MLTGAVKMFINGRPAEASLGHTVMQTCAQVGVDLPRFCYHDKLLIAGNCRICLVEIFGSKKLIASCAVHVSTNMSVYTNTVRVRLARQNILEFLLANHPLDCPICDQGGECDLQDITSVFGADRGRFYEFEKRAVLNKDLGPLIRTSMNRCIHCTRCVRFLTVSSSTSTLGVLGRGSSSEITSYINQFIYAELSGNITDLCPVGALTSKPYSFKARPWELLSVESLDVFDSLNSNIILDIVSNRIARILPYSNESLNECWISNRARYGYDALFVQRLTDCLFKINISWFFTSEDFFNTTSFNYLVLRGGVREVFIKLPLEAARILFICQLSAVSDSFTSSFGNILDFESYIAGKLFFNLLGVRDFFCEYQQLNNKIDFSFLYLFNTSLSQLTKLPSFCFLVGTNTRFESPLINFRIVKLVSNLNVDVYRIGGSAYDFNFRTVHLSNTFITFFEICEFRHPFCKMFYSNSFTYRPFILIGQRTFLKKGAVKFATYLLTLIARLTLRTVWAESFLTNISADYNSFGFLMLYSGRVHASDFGVVSGILNLRGFDLKRISTTQFSVTSLIYSIGSDTLPNFFLEGLGHKPWLIYQGTHGVGLARKANLVLPVSTYIERTSFYKNLLGSLQVANNAILYSLTSRSDTEIFKFFLAGLYRFRIFVFTYFSFYCGIFFNLMLCVGRTWLKNNQLVSVAGWVCPNAVFALKRSSNPVFYYLAVYGNFNQLKVITKLPSLIGLFVYSLFSAGHDKIGRIPLVSVVLNYYRDGGLIFLLASKTMNLCSNLYLKTSVSFSYVYR